jgi:GNAT superfamily N-acetyltransferase
MDAALGNPTIRTATSSDLARLLPHVRDFWAFEKLPLDREQPERALTQLLSEPDYGRVLLLESESAAGLLGYLVLTFGFSLEHGGRDALLDELYVLPAQRGGGLGTLLIEAATQICHAQGITRLHLEVDHSNPRAHSLYARLGFGGNDRGLLTRKLDQAGGT